MRSGVKQYGVQLNVYSVIKITRSVQDEMKAKDDYSDTEYFSYQTNKFN